MAEAGSFADKVKTQADIVRVISDYVRLKKTGQNFTGLCPFHSEKTPSFAVHPVKQIYHCFGCGVGGDVFSFVMAMDKCEFPEAVRTVAEKCGIPIPRPKARTPEEAQANRQRTTLVEMHKEAAAFFARQLNDSPEGKIARAYLEDRGLDAAALARFALGYAPSSGDALLRSLKQKFPEKLIDSSGLVSKDQSGRLFDRFRRRIMFPIANESGKIIAFGGRALGDDHPKYLNSPETLIYSKSRVLYNLHRAKEALRNIRQPDAQFIVLVEGYIDCIQVDAAKLPYVVASCGTSLTEQHAQMLRRFTPRMIVWYDKDSAGKAGTEKSLDVLLGQGLEVEVYDYAHLSGSDPDTYIRDVGADASRAPIEGAFKRLVDDLNEREKEKERQEELRKFQAQNPFFSDRANKEEELIRAKEASKSQIPKSGKPGGNQLLPYRDFLINRTRELFDLSTSEGKRGALNFLLPFVQRVSDAMLRSEWVSRIASQLRIEEPVLREAFRKAAAERKSEVKPKPEFISAGPKPAERRLLRMLIDAEGFRETLAREIRTASLHAGLETEKIFDALLAANESGARPDAAELSKSLSEKDRRLLFEVAFEPAMDSSWEEAESCLAVLRRRHIETELFTVQQRIEANPPAAEMRTLLARKSELRRLLSSMQP